MADTYPVRPLAGARPSLPRRKGFPAFCAALALVILGLGLGPFHPHGAAASRSDLRRGEGGAGTNSNGGTANGGAGASNGSDASSSDGGSAAAGGGGTGHAASTLQRLLEVGQPIYCGAGTKPLVALTFDDGPGPNTLSTIGALRQAGMTATFFEVGKLLGEPVFAGIPRAAARLGVVGDHTWDHISMDGLSTSELDQEIGRTQRALEHLTGQRVELFRPPLGQHDELVDVYLRTHGMLDILWTIDSRDSQGASADQIYRTVRDGLSPGDIVLLHENRGTTQDALPRILHLIEQRGYRTVTVPQLLAADPPTAKQLRTHTCP